MKIYKIGYDEYFCDAVLANSKEEAMEIADLEDVDIEWVEEIDLDKPMFILGVC